MSLSLIAFQPAIDEPSNIWPSARHSSSIRLRSKVTCCSLPRGSVKRKSTYLTSCSLISSRIFLGVVMVVIPFGLDAVDEWRASSYGGRPGFAGADAHHFDDVGDE